MVIHVIAGKLKLQFIELHSLKTNVKKVKVPGKSETASIQNRQLYTVHVPLIRKKSQILITSIYGFYKSIIIHIQFFLSYFFFFFF